jgi:hypothetical protein
MTSSRIDAADFAAAQELYHSRGWTDGLPIVPPTPELVQACLDWALLPSEHLIGVEPVRERAITAEKLAINSVMAGCLPQHFPLVVASFTAMLQDDFLLHGATASTGGCAVLLIINGPIRGDLEMVGTFNALGNADRASSVIGRAVRLGLINLLDVRPGEIDRSTLGHPGKFTYCIAEDEENSSWLSLAEERLGVSEVSSVTAVAAMAPRQIMNGPPIPRKSATPSRLRSERISFITQYGLGITQSLCPANFGSISMMLVGQKRISGIMSFNRLV